MFAPRFDCVHNVKHRLQNVHAVIAARDPLPREKAPAPPFIRRGVAPLARQAGCQNVILLMIRFVFRRGRLLPKNTCIPDQIGYSGGWLWCRVRGGANDR